MATNNTDLQVKVYPALDIYLHSCWEDLNLFLAGISRGLKHFY